LENYSVDVAIIDAQWSGLLEAMKMAAMADAYEVNVASHNFNGPLANIMSAHFCAAIPNFRIMEFDADEVPWKAKLLTKPYVIENGEFLLPGGPGWGTAVNEAVIRAHPAKMGPRAASLSGAPVSGTSPPPFAFLACQRGSHAATPSYSCCCDFFRLRGGGGCRVPAHPDAVGRFSARE